MSMTEKNDTLVGDIDSGSVIFNENQSVTTAVGESADPDLSEFDKMKMDSGDTDPSLPIAVSLKDVDEIDFPQSDSADPLSNDDTVMIGVDVFEESDLETDAENTLKLYSGDGDDVKFMSSSIDVHTLSDKVVLRKAESEQRVKTGKKRPQSCLQVPARLSLDDRIKCIRMCSRYGSYVDAQKAWRGLYGTEPPCRKTLSTLDKKFEKTGTVADLFRSGRPKSTRTEAAIAKVEAAVRKDPNKSIRTLSKELGITQASVHRIKKEFEDKRNTLKMENKKLKEKLNDALKRIMLLERRLTRTLETSSTPGASAGVECMVLSSPTSTVETCGALGGTSFVTTSQIDSNSTSVPTFIALNPMNNQMTVPSVLRLQQPGQEAIHIITLTSSTPQQLLSLDDGSPIQLSIPGESVSQIPTVSEQ